MMTNRIPLLAALCTAALVTSSTAVGHSGQSPAASEKLAKALAGRTAGPPVRCVRDFRNSDMKVIDDQTILFGQGRTIYLQRPAGGCPSLRLGGYSLVARQFATNRMCQGDINEVVDVRSGVTVGSCVFEPFVPYTKGN